MKDQLLNEKYRPLLLSEIVGQDEIIKYLQEYVNNKKVPHMLFAGFQGTGKTTCAIALARELYGNQWKQYFYETNASDERKLDDVRQKIKPKAETSTIDKNFRIIFLDEVDSMDKLGQNALRSIIEKNSSRCRFILSCNWPNKIIPPIVDRCVLFRFKKIKAVDMKVMLDKVVKAENIDITHSALNTLAVLSNGSMRRALNILEKLQDANIKNITDDTIYDTMCYVDDDQIRTLLINVKAGKLEIVDKYMDHLLYDKLYDPKEIIESLWRLIKESDILPREIKLEALSKIGDLEFRISQGSDAEYQLKPYMIYLMRLYDKTGVSHG